MNTLEISNIAAACGKNPYEDKKKDNASSFM